MIVVLLAAAPAAHAASWSLETVPQLRTSAAISPRPDDATWRCPW